MAAFGTRNLVLKVDGTDYSDAVSTAKITSGESDADFTSFEDARSGGARKYQLVMNLKQDSDSAALWYFAWAERGNEVDYELWPNGAPSASATAGTATQPLFSGSVIVMEPDGDFLGGDADPSTTKFFTAEFTWDCTAKPDLDIGA